MDVHDLFTNTSSSTKEEEKEEELQEEDVWDVIHGADDGHPSPSPSPSAWGLITHSSGNHGHHHHPSSAPLKIPDWSKIFNKKCPSKLMTSSMGGNLVHGPDHVLGVDGDDDDDDGEMVPPHEFIARRVAGARIASYSMLEGVGRTLKGRDLRTLRNAILSKTGFLE